MAFIEQNILPKHNEFGLSHGLGHVQHVIKESLKLAKRMGVDVNMVYTVAAYRDIGMSRPGAIHHLTGRKILAADTRLKRWFSPEQIRIMHEAVEDHCTNVSHSPRSAYGKIVAGANRDLEPEHVFRRAVQFGLENEPGKNREKQWRRFLVYLREKYSNTDYTKLWIPNSPDEKRLKTIRSIIENPDKLR